MSSRDLDDFRSALKTGKRQLSRGNVTEAERYLLRAFETTEYIKSEQLKREKRAFVLHRLAEVSVLQNDAKNASRRFKEALKLSNVDNMMGHARLLRDYGNFERIQGNHKIGHKYVTQALGTFESIQDKSDRVTKETLVTEGFLARFDLNDPQRRDEAIETLRIIARKLRGYKKKAYEVANLRCLIDELPFYSLERTQYIQRAILLSLQLSNHRKIGEYTALLGGKSSRGIYNFIVR